MRKTAVVVGGGWAGLCAALDLADRGLAVHLFEKRAILGGRALSFRAREAGHEVDNGQHLLMGCYDRTLAFLARIGAGDRVEIQPTLAVPFLHPERGSAVFRCASLPSPLHLTVGAARYAHLSVAERAKLVAGGLLLTWRHRGGSRATVAQALAAAGQGPNLRTCFWDPLSIAVLNELPERASADLFAEVLRRVFFARARASRIVFPRVGLSELCPEPAARAIEKAGGSIETGRAVREVELEDGRVRAVRFHDGPAVPADVLVLAVPPPGIASLLPPQARDREEFRKAASLRGAPIVSIHFWFAERFATPRMAGFLDGPLHWLFTPPMQPPTGRYVTLVVSGAHDLVGASPETITATARRELRRYLPQIGTLTVQDSLVVKEPAATFAATPDEQPDRPAATTSISNHLLAGDWTATGLPATLESAILSGERAAAAAEKHLRDL